MKRTDHVPRLFRMVRNPRRLHPLVDHQDEIDWSENDLLDVSPAPSERSDAK